MTLGERAWLAFGVLIQVAGWPIVIVGGQWWVAPLLIVAGISLFVFWDDVR